MDFVVLEFIRVFYFIVFLFVDFCYSCYVFYFCGELVDSCVELLVLFLGFSRILKCVIGENLFCLGVVGEICYVLWF